MFHTSAAASVLCGEVARGWAGDYVVEGKESRKSCVLFIMLMYENSEKKCITKTSGKLSVMKLKRIKVNTFFYLTIVFVL